jgi:hypothetical protein
MEKDYLFILDGEYFCYFLDQTRLIASATMLAQTFFKQNPRFAILGFTVDDLFQSSLDQCLCALSSGVGVVFVHRDSNAKETIVAVSLYCDGYDIRVCCLRRFFYSFLIF